MVDLHQELCIAVEQTVIGGLLGRVENAYCEDFYKRYLHDFVRLVHMSRQKDLNFEKQEYEVRMCISPSHSILYNLTVITYLLH